MLNKTDFLTSRTSPDMGKKKEYFGAFSFPAIWVMEVLFLCSVEFF